MNAPVVPPTIVTYWPRVSTSLVLTNVDAVPVTKESGEIAEVRGLCFTPL